MPSTQTTTPAAAPPLRDLLVDPGVPAADIVDRLCVSGPARSDALDLLGAVRLWRAGTVVHGTPRCPDAAGAVAVTRALLGPRSSSTAGVHSSCEAPACVEVFHQVRGLAGTANVVSSMTSDIAMLSFDAGHPARVIADRLRSARFCQPDTDGLESFHVELITECCRRRDALLEDHRPRFAAAAAAEAARALADMSGWVDTGFTGVAAVPDGPDVVIAEFSRSARGRLPFCTALYAPPKRAPEPVTVPFVVAAALLREGSLPLETDTRWVIAATLLADGWPTDNVALRDLLSAADILEAVPVR